MMIAVQMTYGQDQVEEVSAPWFFVDALCGTGSSVSAGLPLPHRTDSTEWKTLLMRRTNAADNHNNILSLC